MEKNNNYFINNMVERVCSGDNTLFLNQAELKKITQILNKKKINYKIYAPYSETEKVIIYSQDEPSVSILEIISKKELNHSEILGSLFGANITPNNYGDIVIVDNKYYLIVLNKLLKFFLTQFNKIGKNNIDVKEASFCDISGYQVKFEELRVLCSSLRVDNVVSSITKLSRNSSDELFTNDFVLLNYEKVKRNKQIEEGDILSIRKYGKYKFNKVVGLNKKGKIIIEILKYC